MRMNENRVKLVADWVKHALLCDQMTQDNFDSIDVKELLGVPSILSSEQISLAFELYEELLRQYKPHSNDLIAKLIFSLEYSDKLEIHTFEELINGSVKLRQTPEFYLVKREPVFEFYVAEEYKKSFTQDIVKAPSGVIYSYYNSLSTGDDDYAHTYVLKHYENEDVEDITGAY
jgi:hypothetical protein